jgi:hypothetical protein
MPSVVLPLLVLVASTSSTPQQAPPAQAQPAPVAKINPLEKIVCRTEDPTGGRLNRQRVCMTVRDWQDQAQENREAVERLQQQGQNVPH